MIDPLEDVDPEDSDFLPIWEVCRPFTMLSFARGLALFRAVRSIHQNFIGGDFVECGVWRGGAVMLAMLTLKHFGIARRRFWLFDTYSGMTNPTGLDVHRTGATAEYLLSSSGEGPEGDRLRGRASMEEVKANIAKTGYEPSLIEYVEGDLCETLLRSNVGTVALLRLDTDYHASTAAALDLLFPRLVPNGFLMVDGFAKWYGARKAVNDYFDDYIRSGQTRPYFHPVDDSGVVAVKPAVTNGQAQIERYDYHAPGLTRAELLGCFPELVARDTGEIDWTYLRREVPHIWRSDARARRQPNTGAISVEEAELLYNNALPFAGKRGIEVGCHYGWSTAHLVKAGLLLDVVDPALGDDHHHGAVTDSLTRVDGPGSFSLWPGYSPGIIRAVSASGASPYSFAFIDGYHEGPAPSRDAKAVAEVMADDACVMFHDLTSPYVAAGLMALARQGWKTGIYNTMQIMGIAWRGRCEPVRHVADPNVPWPGLSHLNDFHMLSVRQGDPFAKAASPEGQL